jgi:DNA polymerase-3 subunit gamma/tau
VIEVGQDPRRFAEDLLRRLRDLVIVAAVPDALTSGLVDVAPDQAERLTTQAASLGAGELTRAAEVIATGLTDMRGTTAPRLHLELMCARVLLPAADVDDRGLHARLDRLERRIGVTSSSNPAPARPSVTPAPSAPIAKVTPPPTVPEITPSMPPRTPREESPSAAASTPEPVEAAVPAQSTQSATTEAQVGLSVTDVRRLWPDVLEEVKGKRRFTWILLSQNARVAELRKGTLLLAMSNAGARDSFARGGNEDVLREAIVVVMGADFAIETMVDPSATPSVGASHTPQAEQTPTALDPPATRATNGAQNARADDPDEIASRDDSDLTEDAQSHTELLARHLGAEIIAEEDHGA